MITQVHSQLTPMPHLAAPTSTYEALVLALFLALTAPSRGQAAEVIKMAEQFAAGLTAAQVEAAKAGAVARYNAQENHMEDRRS